MKYAVPTDDGKTVGKVFGRARNFAIYDTADSSIIMLENSGVGAEHGAGTGAAAVLADKGVKLVIAPEFGPKAANGLKIAGITMAHAEPGTELLTAITAVIGSEK